MNIQQITSPSIKENICTLILNELPEWFGIPESTQEYIVTCSDMPFWAAFNEIQNPIGFIVLKENNPYTCEIYVMGILKSYHHKGIGHALFETLYTWAKNHHYKYLQVKTLDSSNPDPHYAKTRKFYYAMGFSPLECFPELWDPSNPCLIMIQSID